MVKNKIPNIPEPPPAPPIVERLNYSRVFPARQCTREEWKRYDVMQRQIRIMKSPARFRAVTIRRGSWGSSSIFGRCPFCNCVTIFGYCNSCNYCRVCAACRQVIQKDGTTLPILYNEEKDRVSHGICKKCLREKYPEEYSKLHKRGLV